MIYDQANVFKRMREYRHHDIPTPLLTYEQKFNLLAVSLTSVLNILLHTVKSVHLAFSGGLDSAILLTKLLALAPKRKITAHTLCPYMNAEALHAGAYAEVLQEQYPEFTHMIHLVRPTVKDRSGSMSLLGHMDAYYLLMRVLSEYTDELICGDCIDELMGGYYEHMAGYHKLIELTEKVIPDHLIPMSKCSERFGMTIYLPYADTVIVRCAENFTSRELVDNERRKKPMYELGEKLKIPIDLLIRQKQGLNSVILKEIS